MCGISGILKFDGGPVSLCEIEAMNAALAHRGPDDSGVFVGGNIGLGQSRLSVIDLSPKARQPVSGEDEKVTVVCNGEIYNFLDLKSVLLNKGHRFVSDGDSEILPHAYEEWGMEGMLQRLKGMFAFALWDQNLGHLYLARDRLGVKPLNYVVTPEHIGFASEPHALWQLHSDRFEPNKEAINDYLSLGYTHLRSSFLNDIRKVAPASFIKIEKGNLKEVSYWSLPTTGHQANDRSLIDYLRDIDKLLYKAVERRMVSDVPLGVFLSSGIDSGLITAYASKVFNRPIKTFTVDFSDVNDENFYKESLIAKQVADRYETDHNVLSVGADSIGHLPELIHHASEPFADPSLLPTYLMCKAAKKNITVALTGDGGDESFAGYSNIRAAYYTETTLNWIPAGLRKPLFQFLLNQIPRNKFTSKIVTMTRYGTGDPRLIYDNMDSWHRKIRKELLGDNLDLYRTSPPLPINFGSDVKSLTRKLSYIDFNLRLPCGYLRKMDIASNAVAIELRSPFLDHELVEYMWNVPDRIKLHNGQQKGLLRQLSQKYLPDALVRREKMGFSPPVSEWLRTRWRPVLTEFVTEGLSRRTDYFDPSIIRVQVDDHLSLREDNGLRLWQLICLEIWFRIFVDKSLSSDDVIG